MTVCKIKLIEPYGYFPIDKTYIAKERENDFVLFDHTGWFSVPKSMCRKE
jgi:hypothetical protein